ncbi:MAG: hypothetical protein EPN69_15070 [Rhodanobacter sp.]|nr:MAG: hypothetical protein EPN71_17190 [Rhodanobacter sp.]TAL89055.1 MAG: hypothetical protein EPN69_15070 [Rhodanobacter sp.]TAM38826.1 MAG: hypothetical protein EPN58_15535 [Rhodanobacter sp.]TAN28635.1 MAG: hypothetical protein EPN32_02980 [Rhodanobacter sp.]
MSDLARQRPSPIPAIHPLPEYLAEGTLHDRYEDMKEVFQVPWMGVVTMAYAHYPNFYDELWRALRPVCLSRPFVDGFLDLRLFVEAEVGRLHPPPMHERLRQAGYAAREIDQIRATNEVFSHGNYPYLVLATLVRHLLEGGELAASRDTPPFGGRHAPGVSVPFVLMERHHADDPTRRIYDDVMATLGLPFVNTDYRAFARWPSYFTMAWRDLKPAIATRPYEALVDAVHERTVALTRSLPNPRGASSGALIEAAGRDAATSEVTEVCRLFQWLLPGLVTNVAFFRQQLAAG